MSQVYNSIYTGNQIDSSLAVIVDSGVSVAQLQVLVGASSGVAVAGKAVVLDANRNYSNIGILSAASLKANYLDLLDGTTDPAETPAANRKFLYYKNGQLWQKNSDNSVVQLRSGAEKVETFTNQTQVVIDHQFKNKFPNVIIAIGDKDVKSTIEYTDIDTLTVRFTQPQSGTIICRIV